MSTGCVYKFTNKVNGKIYIGKTIDWKRRKRDHRRSAKNPKYYFGRALRKHGWDNFEIEILIDNIPEDESSKLEIKFIQVHKSNNSKFGYNQTLGGEGTSGCEYTAEQREANSKRNTKNHTVEGGGNISFCKGENKWRVYGKSPEKKHVGNYDKKEKAEKALALYNTTGERIPSDIKIRRKCSGSISFYKSKKKWEVRSKYSEKKRVGQYFTKKRAEEALALYNTTGEIMPSDIVRRRKGTGSISFNKKEKKWLVRGKSREQNHVGLYLTKEKAEEALDLYNTTGERMPSDIETRRKGTGTITKRKSGRFIAVYKRKSIGTFGTEADAEAALEKLWRK